MDTRKCPSCLNGGIGEDEFECPFCGYEFYPPWEEGVCVCCGEEFHDDDEEYSDGLCPRCASDYDFEN